MRVLLILIAACFFFLSISSVVWGILHLLHHSLEGLWFLAAGLLAQMIAVSIALLAGISKLER